METAPIDFLQWGVLGAVIMAMLLGWLWAKPSVDEIKLHSTALQTEIRDAAKRLEKELGLDVRVATGEVAQLRSSVTALSHALEALTEQEKSLLVKHKETTDLLNRIIGLLEYTATQRRPDE